MPIEASRYLPLARAIFLSRQSAKIHEFSAKRGIVQRFPREDVVLFSYSDRPVQEALGLLREQRADEAIFLNI